jgi:excisionase family DNA binding protein
VPPSPDLQLTETFLTVPEAAAEMRVSKSTVYRLIAVRELTAARFGRSVRVPRSALDQYLTPANGAAVPEQLPAEASA